MLQNINIWIQPLERQCFCLRVCSHKLLQKWEVNATVENVVIVCCLVFISIIINTPAISFYPIGDQ